MDIETFKPSNGAGWRLYAKRHIDPKRFKSNLKPVAIVPGYGMNSYIFGYHPKGRSMIEALTGEGFEVWTMNFRAQDETVSEGGKPDYTISDISLTDLPTIIECVMSNRKSRRKKLDIIGCSLGGTYVFAYAALRRNNPLGSIVALGAPLRWVKIHPALKFAFGSPRLVGMLRLSKTRKIARHALPVMAKIPGFLHLYMHPKIVDLSQPELLVKTVENPNPKLNQEIARWVLNKDLVLGGENISERFRDVKNPIYCMLVNADGIVPQATALSALDLSSSEVKDFMVAGTDEIKMAHADMYISDYADEYVFGPLNDWLLAHQ